MSDPKADIFVGVDGSAHADSALLWAWLESRSRDVRLTALHAGASRTTPVVPIELRGDAATTSPVLSEAVARLQEAVSGAHASLLAPEVGEVSNIDDLAINGASVDGPIVPGLLAAASAGQMLVVGRRGLGRLGRIFMGSVSAGLAREAQIPVTIVPAEWPASPGDAAVVSEPLAPVESGGARVVVGVDGSRASQSALVHGIEVARRTGAVLEAVACWQIMMVAPLPHGHGWAPPLEDYQEHVAQMLANTLAEAFAIAGALPQDSVRSVVEHASPARGLLMHSVGAQRLIVGHRGLGGFDRLLLGSVSSQLIEHASCPVTVIRSS